MRIIPASCVFLVVGVWVSTSQTIEAQESLADALREFDARVITVGKLRENPLASMLARDAKAALREANLRDDLGVVVIAMREPDGEIVFNPKGDTILEPTSVLVVVGRREQLDELEKIATGRKAK